jgi:hypothetical protein
MKNSFSLNTILSSRQIVWTKFLLALCILSFTACKKESDVGMDVVPEEDIIGLYTTDTTTLITYTVREDSLRTDETPTVVLGHCNDNMFGTSTCGVYSQFSIPNNLTGINFLSPCTTGVAVLDSCVLMIAYKFDYYGDTNTAQTFSVFQMTDRLRKDSNYYSNQNRNYYPSPIGSLTFNPKPRTGVIAEGDTQAAHIRIPIDMNWASIAFSQSGGANLADNEAWVNYMSGLYITPTGGTGTSLMYFNMVDTLTGLRFYYHTACDTTDFTFVVNTATPYYSRYTHNYSSADPDIVAQLSSGGPTLSGWNYVQSNAGLKTKIEFPFLKNWYDNLGYPAAINKAELVIFGEPDATNPDNFPLNTRMFVTSIDSVNKEHLLIDMFESNDYYGGSLNTTTNMYKINVARYIQSVLSGEREDNGLFLKEIFGTENGRRSKIGSSSSSDPSKRMYLRLVYTRIN